jgi:hypothetical protein
LAEYESARSVADRDLWLNTPSYSAFAFFLPIRAPHGARFYFPTACNEYRRAGVAAPAFMRTLLRLSYSAGVAG